MMIVLPLTFHISNLSTCGPRLQKEKSNLELYVQAGLLEAIEMNKSRVLSRIPGRAEHLRLRAESPAEPHTAYRLSIADGAATIAITTATPPSSHRPPYQPLS